MGLLGGAFVLDADLRADVGRLMAAASAPESRLFETLLERRLSTLGARPAGVVLDALGDFAVPRRPERHDGEPR